MRSMPIFGRGEAVAKTNAKTIAEKKKKKSLLLRLLGTGTARAAGEKITEAQKKKREEMAKILKDLK